ncbi:universal stress protein [Polaribacter sargassicola]|uniref:universal stress protein n=1 Tax=Polaribacter sargassicola TaxID=2836891 RepID=UPI001F15B385|nr:universal stress protein [Polaribacter sp. DS7-9]MCG1035164.1 universal stress protein [Polaribacter sp. DS7-9]
MKNILLPTDFSDNSWNAINYALNFYKNTKCNFYLLHVNKFNDVIEDNSTIVSIQEKVDNITIDQAKIELKLVLEKINKKFSNNKYHNFFTLIDADFFIESLRKYIVEKKIDVLVMGTKGATAGLNKYIIGSNTTDAITKVKCTTLVVPENAKFNRIKEIAFPTDFSLYNNLQLLQPITEILDEKRSYIRIVNISKRTTELNKSQKNSKELLQDYFLNYNCSFHLLTNSKIQDAVQCFVDTNHIDLIAMPAKSLNYFQQMLFHNRVEKNNYYKEVPFLVLHE